VKFVCPLGVGATKICGAGWQRHVTWPLAASSPLRPRPPVPHPDLHEVSPEGSTMLKLLVFLTGRLQSKKRGLTN
jgi:hypothetical protein